MALHDEAAAIESAIEKAIAAGARTADIATDGDAVLTTSEMTDAVIANLC
jgi:3-isopropylmalate dehydrogenase